MASRTERAPHLLRFALTAIVALAAWVALPRTASAYPWMLRHGATQCGACHADPSGSGLLTNGGRARGDKLMRFQWGTPATDTSKGKLFWGVDTPDWLLFGGSIRNGYLLTHINGAPKQPDPRFLQMQADLRTQITVDRFRAHGSLGFLHEGGAPTWVTTRKENNLVSREHWLGVDLGADREWLVRAGRLNLPFGIRGNEHTLWVRKTFRTDVNEGQQHGVAVSYAAGEHRAELMAVVGNLQLRPDLYREQGFVGYYEHAFTKRAAAGVSALFLRASVDPTLGKEATRHGYGAFLRIAPVKPLVLLVEGDAVLQKAIGDTLGSGFVGFFQADLEPVQGIHVMLTGEALKRPSTSGTAIGGWLSLVWFLAPHADLRLDGIYQSVPAGDTRSKATTLLAQMHVYL